MKSNDSLSGQKALQQQIYQLREAISALENENNGYTGMKPEELWRLVRRDGEQRKIHPRLKQILCGYVDIDTVQQSLKRLENDLDDLNRKSSELEHPPKHDLSDEDSDGTLSDTAVETEQSETASPHPQRELSDFSEFTD